MKAVFKTIREKVTIANAETPHIAIVPSPGMGHLIPLVEFAKRLVHQHSFNVTIVIPTSGSPSKAQRSTLESLPSAVDFIFLPPISLSDLPQDSNIGTFISLTVSRSLPALRDTFKSLIATTNLVALVVDLFGTDAFDVANEFNISSYIYFPSSAMALSLFLYLPELDEMVSCAYRDMDEPVRLPGCIPIHGKDLLGSTQDRQSDSYKWLLHHANRYKLAQGIMVNSFMALEGGAIKALLEKEPGKPPVYPVGPIVGMDSSRKPDGPECMKWLDDQPVGSILYVSFGSGGTLSSDQFNELAMGLEISGQRFLWVVRSPNDTADATYFTAESQKSPFEFFPNGFIDRTKGLGLVVPSWAPQVQVLSHGSTGGFISHCGWNSTLESIVNGVPLIAWPLYAEQKMNAAMLTEDAKIALRPKPNENGLICRDEIAKVVKGLMEGEEGNAIRNRMNKLKEAAGNALTQNEDSTKAFFEVANKHSTKLYPQPNISPAS